MSEPNPLQNDNDIQNSKQQSLKNSKVASIKKDSSISKRQLNQINNAESQKRKFITNKNLKKSLQSIEQHEKERYKKCTSNQNEQIFNENSKREADGRVQLERLDIRQQIEWQTAYIDKNFYLSDPTSLTKLRQLEFQIEVERQRLAYIQNSEALDRSFYSQNSNNYSRSHSLKRGQDKDNSIQCMTEINQSKLYERKKFAEKQLEIEEQKYRNKIEELRKKKSITKRQEMSGKNTNANADLNNDNKKKVGNNIQSNRSQISQSKRSKEIDVEALKQENSLRELIQERENEKLMDQNSSIKKAESLKKSKKYVQLEKSKISSFKQDQKNIKSQKNNELRERFEKDFLRQETQECKKTQKGKDKVSSKKSGKGYQIYQLSQENKSISGSRTNQIQQKKQQKMGNKSIVKFQQQSLKNSNIKSGKQPISSQQLSMKFQQQQTNQPKIITHNSTLSQKKIVNQQKKEPSGRDQIKSDQQQRAQESVKKQSTSSKQQLKNKNEESSKVGQPASNIQLSSTKKQTHQFPKSQHASNAELTNQHQVSHKINEGENAAAMRKTDKYVQWQSIEHSQSPVITKKSQSPKYLDHQQIKEEQIKKIASQFQFNNVQSQPEARDQYSVSQIYQRSKEQRLSPNRQYSQKNSEKKATTFKIHEKTKRSLSKQNQKQDSKQQHEQSESGFYQKSQNLDFRGISSKNHKVSSRYGSQSKKNQLQIQKLHQQIAELQKKLRLVQQKQQEMIRFQNNQSKIMNEAGSSEENKSESISPVGKLNSPNRLKLQSKLSLQATVEFNALEWKIIRKAQENEKLEKLRLQEEIGKLKKIIREMQLQKIKSIQKQEEPKDGVGEIVDSNRFQLKVEERKQHFIDITQSNEDDREKKSYCTQQMRISFSQDKFEPSKKQYNESFLKDFDEAGKIKKNSPVRYHIDSPKKYNQTNARKSNKISEGSSKQILQQQKKLQKVSEKKSISKSLNLRRQDLMSKIEENEKNFKQFMESSRNLDPDHLSKSNGQKSHKEIYELQLQTQGLKYKPIEDSPEAKMLRMKKTKNENPESEILNVPEIKIGDIIEPSLPTPPKISMTQDDLLNLAKKTYLIFGIDIDENQNQLCMKKYKNCIVLIYGYEQQNTIVWHYSGKFYFGGWKNTNDQNQGEKCGKGLQYTPGKHIFKGQFLNGKKNGNGIIKFENGNIYEGQWIDGSKNGRGVYFQASTNIFYSGQWKDGRRDGYGILKFSNKQFYEGTFSQSLKHGYGVERFSNGDIYKGQYKNGKFHGKGKYLWANGASYEGDFLEGNRHGQGSWKSSQKSGDAYIGSYQNDKKSGYGRYIWANEPVYEGNFQNDIKNGKGRLIYEDGKQIKGIWKDGSFITQITSQLQSRRLEDQSEEPLPKSLRSPSLKNSALYSPRRRVQNF